MNIEIVDALNLKVRNYLQNLGYKILGYDGFSIVLREDAGKTFNITPPGFTTPIVLTRCKYGVMVGFHWLGDHAEFFVMSIKNGRKRGKTSGFLKLDELPKELAKFGVKLDPCKPL